MCSDCCSSFNHLIIFFTYRDTYLILGLDREYAYLTLHAMAKLYRKCLKTPRTQRLPIQVKFWIYLIFLFLVFQRHFQKYFSYIMVTSFSGRRSRSIRREPPTIGKQLVNFITCCRESSAPFFVIYKAGRGPASYW